MMTKWQAFLQVASPTDALAEGGDFVGLGDTGLLRVTGDDAATFLQGQTTCDIRRLGPGQAGLGALCNPKGRVIADFRILRQERGFYLLLAADLTERVAKRLKMYVLRSRVSIEDLTAAWGIIGLLGPETRPLGLELPREPGAALEGSDTLEVRLGDGRFLLAAEIATAERIWQALTAGGMHPATDEAWRLRDIEAGLPRVTAAVSESFLPQMLNLDLLDALSFNKGCYTGQEIVTRTHFLGQVKRRLTGLRGAGASPPMPGAAVFEATTEEAREVGQVICAAREGSHCWQALAVVNREYWVSGTLRCGSPEGPFADVRPPPYELPESVPC